MKTITQHMQLSKQQRQAHIDLSSPCIPTVATNHPNNTRATPGSYIRKGRYKNNLLAFHNIEDFNGNKIKVEACHLCPNNSTAPNGFICENPKHLYFGTVKENNNDKSKAVRQRAGFGDINTQRKNNASQMARGTHMSQQKVKCIHCGKESTPGNIARWHNDNCKHKV
tara:strand:+ start:17 stop:520 length:504 start_codon:yes stop_codon:yes gene_type:complete